MTLHFLLLSPIEGSSGLFRNTDVYKYRMQARCIALLSFKVASTKKDNLHDSYHLTPKIVANLADSYHLTPKIVANLAVDGIYLTFLKDYESSRST